MDQLEAEKYSSRVLDTIASEENIQYFILGSFGKAGDNYWLTFKIQEAFGRELLATEIKEGKEHIFHSLVDETTEWIKGYFLAADQIAGDIDQKIGIISTSSHIAQKHYFEGIMYARERKFKESIQSLEKAVAIDPEFAMAYKQIASNYNRLDMLKETEEYLLKALELRERISIRERYLIEGRYLNLVKKDYDQAINKYLDVLDLYPEDDEAKLQLGAIYFNIEEWDMALEYYNQVPKTSDISYEAACINIAYIYMAKGWYNQARNVFEANKELFPQVYYLRNMSHTFLYEANYERALQGITEAIDLEPDDLYNAALLGNIYHLNGDLSFAKKTYNKLLEADDPLHKGYGSRWMSKLYLARGQYKKCLDEILNGVDHSKKSNLKYNESELLLSLAYTNLRLDRFYESLNAAEEAMEVAVEIHFPKYQKWALHLQGLACLKMNKMSDAENKASQLQLLIEQTQNKHHMRHYYHLMGMIDLQENQASQAIEEFREAVSLMPKQVYGLGEQAFYIESLASACYKNGNLEEAKNNYDRISRLTWGRIEYGDIHAKSFYWLGKISQELSLTVEAKENYKKFLDLWVDADPADTELADAKKQYEILILD
jgi:tetratricopeptide (TPR) repeat protein